MDLARYSGTTAIEAAACEAGLTLTEDDMRAITETEQACLLGSRRISFGGGVSALLIRAFGPSPYLCGADRAGEISGLVEAFYELREDYPAHITDLDVVEALREEYDDEAAGDASLAAALARERLAAEAALAPYEIIDDDGNAYRWDPAEWHDDVEADGWLGERWDGDYE